ncbi:MAG: malectin domain-containing carbohydrate-binding protein, partial [Chitinophagaceae bacterium]
WTLVSAVPTPTTPATITNPGSASTTITGLQQGTYVFRLTVQDNNSPTKASGTDDVMITVNPQATGGGTAIRVNAGGSQQTNSLGVFSADVNYSPSPGNTYSVSSSIDIANTTDDAIYRSERYGTNGTMSYAFPVVNGSYMVRLHFSENYHTSAGKRIFDISMEGVKVKDNFDVFAKAGAAFTATTETFQVNITDGILNMYFSSLAADGGVDQPKVSAIEILSTTSAMAALNIGVIDRMNQDDGLESSFSLQKLSATVSPNPSAHTFILHLRSTSTKLVTVRIFDAVGRLMEPERTVAASSTILIGQNYRPGIYYVEMLHNNKKVIKKLVKQ